MELKIHLARDVDYVYTTRDIVDGHVKCCFNSDTAFDQFGVKLVGRTSTCMKDTRTKPTTQRYVHGDHTFLQMSQPVESIEFPSNGIAERGQNHGIPFAFTVPDSLLPYGCSCDASGRDAASDGHLSLPPSFPGLERSRGVFRKPSGARETQVTYTIEVQFRLWFSDGTSKTIKKTEKICVIPSGVRAVSVEPRYDGPKNHACGYRKPFPVGRANDGTSGQLEASIAEPLDLELRHPGEEERKDATLSIPVRLQFRPSLPNSPPPDVASVTMTVSSATAWATAMDKNLLSSHEHGLERKIATSKICTKRVSLRGLVWTMHPEYAYHSQDECQSHTALRNPVTPAYSVQHSSNEASQIYMAASRLPLDLFEKKRLGGDHMIVPTFSSCTVSRSYSIELDFTYNSKTCQRQSAEHMHLAVQAPLRICYTRQPSLLRTVGAFAESVDGLESKWAERMHVEMSQEAPPAYTAVLRS